MSTEPINVIIPQEMLNDHQFISNKLLEVKLDVLTTLSKNTAKSFAELVVEFLPELNAHPKKDALFARYHLPSTLFSEQTPNASPAEVANRPTKKITIRQKTTTAVAAIPTPQPEATSMEMMVDDSPAEAVPVVAAAPKKIIRRAPAKKTAVDVAETPLEQQPSPVDAPVAKVVVRKTTKKATTTTAPPSEEGVAVDAPAPAKKAPAKRKTPAATATIETDPSTSA